MIVRMRILHGEKREKRKTKNHAKEKKQRCDLMIINAPFRAPRCLLARSSCLRCLAPAAWSHLLKGSTCFGSLCPVGSGRGGGLPLSPPRAAAWTTTTAKMTPLPPACRCLQFACRCRLSLRAWPSRPWVSWSRGRTPRPSSGSSKSWTEDSAPCSDLLLMSSLTLSEDLQCTLLLAARRAVV
jgi:hypothetical protein